MANNITTMKIDRKTKERLNHLRVYRRETYDEILKKMLDILSIARISPEKAQATLASIDRKRKKETIKALKQAGED